MKMENRSQLQYIVDFFLKALYFPKTVGHCNFKQTLHKQEKIELLFGTIFHSESTFVAVCGHSKVIGRNISV